MKQIFSPDRIAYIRKEKKMDACVFCALITGEETQNNYIVYQGENIFVTLNLYPYSAGHLLVLPKRHIAHLNNLNEKTRNEIMTALNTGVEVLKQVYSPTGFNLGANLGEDAGAGIADHLHFHIIPRWRGDANFLSVIGETRVIPQSLIESYQEIKKVWQSIKS